MKKTVLQIQYTRLLALYHKLNTRLTKHFNQGRFYQFTKNQQQRLLRRIEKLKAQLSLLGQRIQLTGATLTFGLVVCSANANAQFTQVGAEFQVNTSTYGDQSMPAITINDNGNFIVAWETYTQNATTDGIYSQRYNSAGQKQGTEFKVSTYTTNDQTEASIAMDNDGDFVITWNSYGQDGSKGGIYAQRYDAAGIKQGNEFRVNTYTTNEQRHPEIAMDSDGDFVIAWESVYQDGSNAGIFAQRYNAAGIAQGTEFLVNTVTYQLQQEPSIAMDDDGNFIIAWQSSPYATRICAQRYNAAGQAQGNEFDVSTYTATEQMYATIAMDNEGDFVIAWQREDIQGNPNDIDIYARRYNSEGLAQGTEFQVNTFTTHWQMQSTISMDNDGDFAIFWTSYGQNRDIYGQRYNADGLVQGAEFKVNTYTFSLQALPSVAMDYNGNFVVSWYSSGQDGSAGAVEAQRYAGESISTSTKKCVDTESITLYPNPANGQVHLNIEGSATVKILDVSGRILKEQIIKNNIIDIQDLIPGFYMVIIDQDSKKIIEQLLVE